MSGVYLQKTLRHLGTVWYADRTGRDETRRNSGSMLYLDRTGKLFRSAFVRTSLSSITSTLRTNQPTVSLLPFPSLIFSPLPSNQALRLAPYNVPSRPYASISSEAAAADFTDEAHSADSTLEPPENPTQETVEELLRKKNEVAKGDLQATTNTKPVLGIRGFTSSIKIN
ncbi:hypothetical protein DVH24_026046 [Malus domestica]|uniref:Uncharacterized protein n=1 Tax=Malus domestica TaxID=3750 RepID=A0A498KEY6_MALDO|nr:hypothetical protein DVH24_026046 [Malus domestica]